MLHTDGMTSQVRLGVLVAVVVALLGGLVYPAWADLLVSDFTNFEIRKFTDAGASIPPVPFFTTAGGGGSGGEGFACVQGGAGLQVYTSNEGTTIFICTLSTPNSCVPFLVSARPGTKYAAIAASPDGSLLYAADDGQNFIDAYSTATRALLFSVSTQASHDVRVGSDGSVYATSFVHNTGVVKFTATLASPTQFIAPGDHGLNCPSGMTFDAAGNFWVGNPSFVPATCPTSFVSKYDASGNFIGQALNPPSNILLNPIGLDVGPDGNIYAASFGNNFGSPTLGSDIAQINSTTFAVSLFIPPGSAAGDAGINSKYLLFTQHCVVPPPPPPDVCVLQDDVPGSLLVCPIFDVFGGNQTKIRVTCNGVTGTRLRFTYVCQPQGTSNTSLFCPSFDEAFPCTPHQTLVVDVGTELFGACPTGQGYVVVFAEDECTTASATFNASTQSCATATGGSLPLGEFGPISYNQLFGSCHLYYNGGSASALTCGGVPCAPPALGPNPDVEAINAIGIQSPQAVFSFLGNDTGGALSITFGPTTAFDYCALPKVVETDFAAPGAALIAGPSTFPPFIGPDTVSGTELETNIILLNLNYTQFAANLAAAMSVNSWNWFEVGFTATHRFICWERVPINLIDPRITAAGPFGAPYGNIRFTPSPLTGPTSPHLLGAIEEVADVGRTLRTMIHSSIAASPGIFITDIE